MKRFLTILLCVAMLAFGAMVGGGSAQDQSPSTMIAELMEKAPKYDDTSRCLGVYEDGIVYYFGIASQTHWWINIVDLTERVGSHYVCGPIEGEYDVGKTALLNYKWDPIKKEILYVCTPLGGFCVDETAFLPSVIPYLKMFLEKGQPIPEVDWKIYLDLKAKLGQIASRGVI